MNFTSNDTFNYNSKIYCDVDNINEISKNYKNISSFDYIKYSKSNKIFYELELYNCRHIQTNSLISSMITYKYKLVDKINQNYEYSELINALVLGVKDFNETEKTTFQNNNILHLITISGLHVNIIILIISKFLSNSNKSKIILSALLILYCIFLEFQIPVVRATLFYISFNFFKVDNKINFFYITTAIILVLNPLLVINSSFILSYLIFYLIIYSKEVDKLELQLLITCSIFPIVLNFSYTFNFLSLFFAEMYSLLFTLLLMPISIIIIVLTSLDIYLPILQLPFSLTYQLLNLTQIHSQIHFHFSSISILVYYFCFIIAIKLKKILLFTLIVVITFISIPQIKLTDNIYFIDINQGKSSIIITKYNEVIVIDSGSSEHVDELVNFLNYHGVFSIDHYIITHRHEDHYGGTESLFDNFTIKNVYSSFKINGFIHVTDSFTINLKNKQLDLLTFKSTSTSENNNSIITKLSIGETNIMWTGDIEEEIEKELIQKLGNLKIDILDVAHHGSSTSTSEQFLEATKPKFAIIQFGINNKYAHPHDSTLQKLIDRKIVYFCPSIDGSVFFKFKSDKLIDYGIIN